MHEIRKIEYGWKNGGTGKWFLATEIAKKLLLDSDVYISGVILLLGTDGNNYQK